MTTLSHPYKDCPEPKEVPPQFRRDVDALFEWIKQQPRFPAYTRNHAHLFLHACLWDVENAKKALHKYGHIHATAPDIFDNRDVLLSGSQSVLNMAQLVSLPKLTPEGYRLLCYRLSDTDPSRMNFGEAIKLFCMFNDVQISKDGPIEGYIVIFDMKGVRLGHLARVQFSPLRVFMSYIQDAHPVRLKKIYIVHTASFINQVMALIKPLIRSELLGLLQFCTSGPLDILEAELLPQDYGGTLPEMAALYGEQRNELETEYREWLINSAVLKEAPKEKNNPSMRPPVRSFRGLEID
ncbi:alpha-tocopherol transfer protein-like [Toxorhynchites rutilus septentrionalis]|uniref:alpha-tocopherol transfer protein-like n=1 Tax=Toxorhynchites rutilus septentrionalis TaxID=329112 RepID=UPI002478CB92|nr:alpha-tocopherol transfer protein-like [Toxorhynchites rutilus septentrionalis]XP_055636286.1 alpha-tocopherol transfer protein-like [Toxorhynchites rutilus septentrionalis]XP_055636287.1 alpha-tocopherol transfer protein-like [Toxorhynchites rutilus septentrionalis]XP_055636288.1 alpha-tocopherol transfer protein-like [Toxorhynchites rutilus septentrionalis]XP_055636290.1 alpha-tocopherol transfer protein-like [Toxorhynchites rutilus septentrionalis]